MLWRCIFTTVEVKMKVSKAFEQVFGQVGNGSKIIGKDEHGKPREMRVGKTERDKANGHVPYRKNRRIWDSKEGWKKS
ncbi:hypothetical protein HWC29_gp061 [Aeromonas phage 4_4572]|uniref:Uncharacterized protein n=3 Tax=Lahexavirus TaxID=2843411 RepID=A0A5B9N8F2_9CAUD|nr:hypothetical protein HWC29_gp061 [Aeromonas phage 4_4572]QEG09125.1 hypothetical protein [Aeromonas phage 4_4572]